MFNFQKHYYADITQSVEQLLATDDVKQALGLVKEQLLETIEIQKELSLAFFTHYKLALSELIINFVS